MSFKGKLSQAGLYIPLSTPALSTTLCVITVQLVFGELLTVAVSCLVMANERLRALEDVEKEIAMILQCAGEDII